MKEDVWFCSLLCLWILLTGLFHLAILVFDCDLMFGGVSVGFHPLWPDLMVSLQGVVWFCQHLGALLTCIRCSNWYESMWKSQRRLYFVFLPRVRTMSYLPFGKVNFFVFLNALLSLKVQFPSRMDFTWYYTSTSSFCVSMDMAPTFWGKFQPLNYEVTKWQQWHHSRVSTSCVQSPMNLGCILILLL